MIGRTVKIQLLVFAIITMVGVSYVGATYAGLDRAFTDTSYTVTANFAESGGIFTGAEVTYRGVRVGRVAEMRLSREGVYVDMEIEHSADPIPRDVTAVVANKSALGEQYVDLQPERQGKPYLREGADIARPNTETPISSSQLLLDLDQLVNSVDRRDLRVVVDEFGKAFEGTGQDLGHIIDTTTSYIDTANDHFDLTEQLIRDGRQVLRTQLDSRSAIKTFSTNLAQLSDTLVAKDRQIRQVIDRGGVAARELREFIDANADDLSLLLNNLVTTGEITVARLHGLEQVLVLYPYVIEGAFTVASKDPVTGLYDAHFGLALTLNPPVCTKGYETKQREPANREERPMITTLNCEEPPTQSSPRGAQNAPQPLNRAPVVATYDPSTGAVKSADEVPGADRVTAGGQARLLGKDSWKWLLLGPLAAEQ